MDDDTKRAVALWRLSVLGPLISTRLEHGDRRAYFREAAGRLHQRPDGRYVRLSVRTIARWFHLHRQGGFEALYPSGRSDAGQSRAIRPDVAELVVRAKREKPRRSVRRIIRMLERGGVVRRGELSRSSVHRLLRARGMSSRPLRGPSAERRSFLVERAGDLWMGDALHGPKVLGPDGAPHKAYLLTQLDGATRAIPHGYFALSEDAVAHEHGFKQAILKYGPPRTYYVDLGAAYVAGSLRAICAELGIHLVHTAPGDCEAKGAIERFNRTVREEVLDELDEGRLRTLGELNSTFWAWLGSEYHQRRHTTTGRAPGEHLLEQASELRTAPAPSRLDEIFLHRLWRKVRKDATVQFRGRLYEVRPELVGQRVELRFDPADATATPRVFVGGRFVCDAALLDRHRNAARRRRRDLGTAEPDAEPSGLDPLRQIEDEHYRRTRQSRKDP